MTMRPSPLITPILGVLTLFTGCTVGPDYRAPTLPIEASFHPTTQPAVVNASPINSARWWQTLHDPLLDHLIQQTVASNLDVRIAQSRVRQARAQLAYASGGQYPNASVSAAYAHNRLSKTAAPYNAFDIPGFPWEYDQYQAGFDASWELDIFGGTRRAIEASRADLAAQDADRQDILLSAMAEVARNYIDLRGYQRRYQIAQENLHAQRETLEVTQDRLKNGVGTDLDVARAQAQVAKTEARLPLLFRQQSQAMHRIATLTGQQPEALTAELAKPAPLPVPPPEIAIGVPAELLRRRPDIRRAERQLAAATARIGQATADLYPHFSLTGNFAMISADTNQLFDWRSRSFGIGPTVSWPIFDAGRLRRVIDIRSAQQEQALAEYERTVLGALEEVHNAIVTFATEQERHASLARAVAADKTAADVAQAQYRQGVVDFLNVLDAQRSLFESQDDLADSDRAVTTALVALYKALAGGWQPLHPADNRPQSRAPQQAGAELRSLKTETPPRILPQTSGHLENQHVHGN
jgi:NodT family efflux transporter outer membrane factor (OMF) lipoprotein